MSDLLMKLNRNPLTGKLTRMAGLPDPVTLVRADGGYEPAPFKGKRIVLARTAHGYAATAVEQILLNGGASVETKAADSIDILVFDGTGCSTLDDMRVLYDTFHPLMRSMARNARVLMLAAVPHEQDDPVAAALARGIEGFSRSAGKELGKRGTTVNLAYVARDAVDRLGGVVRFFCGPQTTYVSGQALHVAASVKSLQGALPALSKVLDGRIALVTGAAGGIGAATAARLAQEGARVVCLDVAAAADALHQTCSRVGAIPLMLDITAAEAPAQLGQFLQSRFGGVDIVVHNAGITRDRTLGKMSESEWDKVMAVNFKSIVAIDAMLLEQRLLRDEGRVVCLSSISGVAGNFGQTNYALTKAALIGYVNAQSRKLAARGICVNAVAPGFIETAMTGKMPFMTRELGRRLNAVQQGGLPRDVAEAITFLCTPGALGVSGQTLRVCGQGLVGA